MAWVEEVESIYTAKTIKKHAPMDATLDLVDRNGLPLVMQFLLASPSGACGSLSGRWFAKLSKN